MVVGRVPLAGERALLAVQRRKSRAEYLWAGCAARAVVAHCAEEHDALRALRPAATSAGDATDGRRRALPLVPDALAWGAVLRAG
eukprot:2440244-Prymnesium_polylepis.1